MALKRRKFGKARFYGRAILDNLHSRNTELSKDEIEAINTDERQLWEEYTTNYLSNFEDKLSSGNIRNEDVPITGWRLKRRREDENIFTHLKTLGVGEVEFQDWTAANKIKHEYAIHALSSDIEGVGAFGNSNLDFWGWILTDGVNNYKFDTMLESGEIPTNTNMVVYDNYSRYPKVSFDNRGYKQGSISTMPLEYNDSQYVFKLTTLNEIECFINNKKKKLLKNTKGEVFWVATSNFRHTYEERVIGEPFTITFDWIEIGDGKNPLGGGDL